MCRRASFSAVPVIAIVPNICQMDTSQFDCVAEARRLGAQVLMSFYPQSRAFVPFHFWIGESSAGLNRRLAGKVTFVIWKASLLTAEALAELKEVLALGCPPGKWPSDALDPQVWGEQSDPPAFIPKDPLRFAREEMDTAAKDLDPPNPSEVDEILTDSPHGKAQDKGPLSDVQTLMDGPWAALRWWTADGPLGTLPDGA